MIVNFDTIITNNPLVPLILPMEKMVVVHSPNSSAGVRLLDVHPSHFFGEELPTGPDHFPNSWYRHIMKHDYQRAKQCYYQPWGVAIMHKGALLLIIMSHDESPTCTNHGAL